MKTLEEILKGNLTLKLLALALAIILYYTLKNETSAPQTDNDRSLFQSR